MKLQQSQPAGLLMLLQFALQITPAAQRAHAGVSERRAAFLAMRRVRVQIFPATPALIARRKGGVTPKGLLRFDGLKHRLPPTLVLVGKRLELAIGQLA